MPTPNVDPNATAPAPLLNRATASRDTRRARAHRHAFVEASDPVAAARPGSFFASGNIMLLPGLVACVVYATNHLLERGRSLMHLHSFLRAQNDLAILGSGPAVLLAVAGIAFLAVAVITAFFVTRSRRLSAPRPDAAPVRQSGLPAPQAERRLEEAAAALGRRPEHGAGSSEQLPWSAASVQSPGAEPVAAAKRPALEHVALPCEAPVAYSRNHRPLRRLRSQPGSRTVLPPAVAATLQAQVATGSTR